MRSMNRQVVKVGDPIPLIGHIAFGIIDRGTNLLQVRPTSLCPLSCVFCSVDAGPSSRRRITEYVVDVDYLLRWFQIAVRLKGLSRVHAYIDAAGDPLTHPEIVKLVEKLKGMDCVESVALETHGATLTMELAERLDDAGLDRINLSLDALDPQLARRLAGAEWFDVTSVMKVAEYIATSLRMDILIAPVWVPGLNTEEIPKIIEFSLRIGAGKRWPPLGIQKYEAHKYGRKPPGVRPISWGDFYKALRRWGDEYGVDLILEPGDFGIRKAAPIPLPFKRFERVPVSLVCRGLFRGQWLGFARDRVVTVVGVGGDSPLKKVNVKMLRVKDNIYLAEVI